MEKKCPKPINKIPFKFDSRYVFSDTINRILKIIGDERGVENLIMSTQLPYVFTNKPIPLIFTITLKEAMIQEPYSNISWMLINNEIPSPILITFYLTENTLEKNVLVIFEIEIMNRKLISEIYFDKIKKIFPQICIEIIKNMEKELEKDSKDIYHYESKIFNYSRDKIWEIITNYHCLMSQQGIIKDCSLLTPISKEGIELSFLFVPKNKLCKLKINKYKKDEKNKKWTFGSLPIYGPFAHLEMKWNLVKLGENETLVTNTSKYVEHIDSDIITQLSKEKINTFLTIENFLKEKYGKDNNNNENNISNKKD